MDRKYYFIGIAAFGMVNGLPFLNPFYIVAFVYTASVMAAPLFESVSLIAFFTSLMMSTATIIAAGVPAALYERYVGAKDDSTDVSLWIWLTCTALLALPAVGNFFEVKL
jgi:hypothetical protein